MSLRGAALLAPGAVMTTVAVALLTLHEAKAVLARRLKVGQATRERTGAKSVEQYLAMSEEHERRQRGMD